MPTGSLRSAFAWVDQIGFGKSSKPHAYQFTFQALAENTNGLLDHLGVGRVHVVGHSMGGMLGTRFALIFPDRTDRLVLVNPIGLEDWKTIVPYLTVDQFFAGELQQAPESIREYERLVRHLATPFVRTLPAMISAASPPGIGVQAESLRKGRSARPLPADS